MSTPVVRQREEALLRQLSVVGLWLLIINGMIGAGIFGLPAELARLAGHGGTWIFLLCALMIAPIMLCFAQLSSYFRGTGGPILYAAEAFGPMAGFQVGWLYYISRVLSFAANLNLLIASLAYFWPGMMDGSLRVAVAFVICASMAVSNILGARGAVRALGVLTVLKFLPLIGIVAVGLVVSDVAGLLPSVDHAIAIDDLGGALFLVIYAYVGFEGGLVPAGEANRPQRDFPRALVLALLVCAVLYTLIQAVSLASLPNLADSPRPLVDVAAAQMGDAGAMLMLVAIIASVGGNLLGAMFSTSRLSYRLALDGFLPSVLAWVHPRFHTPVASIVLYAAASFGFAISGGFVWLAGLSLLARIILYAVCASALPRLRRRYGAEPGAIHLPGGLLWMMLALAVCIALLWQVTLQSIVVSGGCVLAGLLLYALARHARRHQHRSPANGQH
jgi:amino acid transporter